MDRIRRISQSKTKKKEGEKVNAREEQVMLKFSITGHINTFVPVEKGQELDEAVTEKCESLENNPNDIFNMNFEIDKTEVE